MIYFLLSAYSVFIYCFDSDVRLNCGNVSKVKLSLQKRTATARMDGSPFQHCLFYYLHKIYLECVWFVVFFVCLFACFLISAGICLIFSGLDEIFSQKLSNIYQRMVTFVFLPIWTIYKLQYRPDKCKLKNEKGYFGAIQDSLFFCLYLKK